MAEADHRRRARRVCVRQCRFDGRGKAKGIVSAVAGRADIRRSRCRIGTMLVATSNTSAMRFRRRVGAAVPIVLPSRADPLESRVASCALAVPRFPTASHAASLPGPMSRHRCPGAGRRPAGSRPSPEIDRQQPDPASAIRNSGRVPHRSTTCARSHTPADCPLNRNNANSDTAASRASGAICVALTCSVL